MALSFPRSGHHDPDEDPARDADDQAEHDADHDHCYSAERYADPYAEDESNTKPKPMPKIRFTGIMMLAMNISSTVIMITKTYTMNSVGTSRATSRPRAAGTPAQGTVIADVLLVLRGAIQIASRVPALYR